ncbi:hypothetical protein LCGC14_0884800 [marine sediment metagenome]|uniref:Uncharacterized protein n=1 Tax=marine sediment metagenome TaxID=412755 RepID=A0A0F9S7W3_9ZZZZ
MRWEQYKRLSERDKFNYFRLKVRDNSNGFLQSFGLIGLIMVVVALIENNYFFAGVFFAFGIILYYLFYKVGGRISKAIKQLEAKLK